MLLQFVIRIIYTSIGTCPTCSTISTLNILMPDQALNTGTAHVVHGDVTFLKSTRFPNAILLQKHYSLMFVILTGM